MIIRFTPDAESELAEARQWYAHQQEYLDVDFMSRIDEALIRIVNNPFSYPVVYGTLRRAVVRRFPFAIFYEITTDEIQVIAVFHSRRDPKSWQSRVELR
jgi:plasmid stabilization system protein ParE